MAAEVRARLSRANISTLDVPAPLFASDAEMEPTGHVCVYIQVSDGGVEVDRVAASHRTPLIRLATPDETPPASQELAAMRATWLHAAPDGRAFPSAVGRVPGLAFETLLIAPNQPETGELTVRVGEPWGRSLPPGTSVQIRCLPEALLVEAIGIHGTATTWLAGTIEVIQRAGLHRVFRDGRSVADLGAGLRVDHLPSSLRLHIV
ncbi:hypothetical protein [Pimelobacter sp. 30-1]|uniref:hypothetical protein n=1 Tax=Pimelobacter sp. 30-1 TaxID=2004991 RepID=UPI001C0530F6|nr:hypothetical protein [Pimelobacter sp. 30-1]MBU2697665.1 hypothetical protein [Pimelobacter sp. 30-1]